ncbi:hypothetical protein [Ochrobactrum soli]|uniref:Uncharacterized protein n=1 Tax=Ochrobactrum soli TaxID=2448455 RepID=A0A2P9HLT6_9HYPH|nr:hypothetical protein [[Ochrobactrum] soli]SPL65062.1 hypothetical protein OHAE_929 [[Ochrobactrum] soli]
MAAFPITTTLISDDLAIGWQTALGLTVDFSPIEDSAQIVRSWNGQARNLAAEEFKLFQCTISSSDDMRPPALSHMWPGSTFTIIPPCEFSDAIQPGAQSRTLIRYPYKVDETGYTSIRCLTKNFEPVPFTVWNKVITLAAPATETVRIFYRPWIDLFVTEPWSVSSHEQNATVQWSLTAEEIGGTAWQGDN